MAAKKTTKRKRYTAEEKQEILDYISKVNAEQGRGGNKAASEKFGVPSVTLSQWLKKTKGDSTPAASSEVSTGTSDLRVNFANLMNKKHGFNVRLFEDKLSGEEFFEMDPKLEKLDLTFKPDGDKPLVTGSKNKLMVQLPLEEFLRIQKII